MHPTGRVDRADARGHLVDLRLAHGAVDGLDLPVGIGDADVVQVEQADLADAAARQGLGDPGTDPAEPDHRHVRSGQPLEPVAPVKPGYAAETLLIDRHLTPPENQPRL